MLHYPYARPAPAAAGGFSRRAFLHVTGGAGVGLLVGAAFAGGGAAPARAAAGGRAFTPFVRIAPDSSVTVIVKHLDKGQGPATGLATLVADELDAGWEQMRVAFAPADTPIYKNLLFGVQGTGGSTAMANSFEQYRAAGAAARAVIVAAAAAEWGVPAAGITVSGGVVSHGSGASATFGELAERAAGLPLPDPVPALKTPDRWVYIGKHFPRIDSRMKTEGAAGAYGMDVQHDDMVVAVVARPPRWGAVLASLDDAAARRVRGVVDVVAVPQGVAVLATSTWPAIRGREALEIGWDFANAENRGTDALLAEYRRLAATPGTPARDDGDAAAGLAAATGTVIAEYVFPYLCHAPMEPLDVTVLLADGRATFWTGSQLQTVDQHAAAAALGLDPADVFINTTWAGGSFGRRAVADAHYVVEAAMIAKAWGRPQPVKVVWTREDDIRGGYYRPMYVHRVEAGVAADGGIAGWRHRIVGQSIFAGTAFESLVSRDGIDPSSVEGVADTVYRVPNMHVDLHSPPAGVPVLWWRSVGHTHAAYAMETMMDELAHAAGRDPVAFRLAHLQDAPRLAGVLRLAAARAGWSDPAPPGRHRGVAAHKSFGTHVAEVAEVSLRADGTVRVDRVVCAVDCGLAINPDNVRAQMEGGIGYGLGAILRNEVTLTDGEVDQANFDTYEPLRITDMPDVEVHIVDSTEAPTGVGEPGTPPIGPAVANAVFAATGRRVRELPFTRSGLA